MFRRTASKAEQLHRALLAEAEASGKTLVAFCAERGLPPGRLYWWRHKLRWRVSVNDPATANSPMLLPVRVIEGAPTDAAPANSPTYELVLRCGRVLRLPIDLDPSKVAALVRTLEASC